MLRFSIRHILIGTAYIAVGCAASKIAGFWYFLWFNLLVIQLAVVTIASVGMSEYSGHRRRFCVASLIVLCGFLTWMFLGHYNLEEYIILSIIGLTASYFTGLFSAAAYLAISATTDAADVGRMLRLVTSIFREILPIANTNESDG